MIRTKIYMAGWIRRWRSMLLCGCSSVRPTDRPLQDRLFERYEKGLHVPRDRSGGLIERMEHLVPGTAALFRSPVWPILKGRPPEASILRAKLRLDGPDTDRSGAAASTFADLEALMIHVELTKSEGRHDAFARAVSAVADVIPQVRFISELDPEADAFSAFLANRLLVWQSDVDDRRARGLLVHPADATTDTCSRGLEAREHGQVQVGSRWMHASVSLGFLLLSAIATDSFSQIAVILMAVIFTTLACSTRPHFVGDPTGAEISARLV